MNLSALLEVLVWQSNGSLAGLSKKIAEKAGWLPFRRRWQLPLVAVVTLTQLWQEPLARARQAAPHRILGWTLTRACRWVFASTGGGGAGGGTLSATLPPPLLLLAPPMAAQRDAGQSRPALALPGCGHAVVNSCQLPKDLQGS